MVQAYNAAAVIPPDITRVCVGEVFWLLSLVGRVGRRRKKVRRKERID